MTAKKFTGELGKKISLDEYRKELAAYLANDEEKIKALKNNKKKLELLYKHYGIKGSNLNYIDLFLALVHDIVPAFQVETKGGRDIKWNYSEREKLVNEIDKLRKEKSKSKVWACKTLANREPWKSFLESKDSFDSCPDPGEALRQQYYYHVNYLKKFKSVN